MNVLIVSDQPLFSKMVQVIVNEVIHDVVVKIRAGDDPFPQDNEPFGFDVVFIDCYDEGSRQVRFDLIEESVVAGAKTIVAVGSSNDREVIIKAISCGATSFVSKLFTERQFACVVGAVLHGAHIVPANAAEIESKPFTREELEFLALVQEKLSNKVIASRLDATEASVKSKLFRLCKKTHSANRKELSRYAEKIQSTNEII